jgi:hypothetical protein
MPAGTLRRRRAEQPPSDRVSRAGTISLLKNFQIRERLRMQFRFETFNTLITRTSPASIRRSGSTPAGYADGRFRAVIALDLVRVCCRSV